MSPVLPLIIFRCRSLWLASVAAHLWLSLLLFSCQQLSFKSTVDYSGLLPAQQLLYLSLSVQSPAAEAGFPYRTIPGQFFANRQLQAFVGKRLRRSQVALGGQGEVYAISQLTLNEQWFGRQMARATAWRAISQLPLGYLRTDGSQALQMPERDLLYLSQQLQPQPLRQIEEQQQFYGLWQSGGRRNQLPQRFRELQDEQPLVAYSPDVAALIASPGLRKAFPATLSSFARLSGQFPVSELLVWVSVTGDRAVPFWLSLELTTQSQLVSRGLEAGFRLFLPSLILRSKQEFLRSQLSRVRLQSKGTQLLLEIPMNAQSIAEISRQIPFSAVN